MGFIWYNVSDEVYELGSKTEFLYATRGKKKLDVLYKNDSMDANVANEIVARLNYLREKCEKTAKEVS